MSSGIQRTIKGGAGFFSAKLISKGLGFLFIIVTSRYLGPVEFGVLSLGLSVTGAVRNFAVFGLPNTIQRFLSGARTLQKEKILGAVLVIGIGTGVFSSVGLYGLAPLLSRHTFGEPGLVTPIRVLSAGVLAGVGWALLRAVLQAQERVREIVVLQSFRSAGKLVIVLLILIWIRTAASAAWAVVGAFMLGATMAVHYVRRLDIQPSFKLGRKQYWRVLEYSAPLVVVGFSFFLAQQADRLMLGWLTNAEVVGLYTVASTLAMIMSTLHSSLVSIFKPLASKIYRNNSRGDMQEMYLFISKWVGGLNGIVLLTFSGSGTWILAVFSPEYSNLTTYYVLVILSTLYYTGTWIGPTGALLQMTDGHRIEFLNTSIFVAVNIGLNFVLIEIYGIIGAAIATFASSLLTNIIRACEIYYINSFLPFRKDNIVLLAITVVGLLSVIKIGPSVVGMGVSSSYILIITLYMIYSISKKERRVFASLSDNIY